MRNYLPDGVQTTRYGFLYRHVPQWSALPPSQAYHGVFQTLITERNFAGAFFSVSVSPPNRAVREWW